MRKKSKKTASKKRGQRPPLRIPIEVGERAKPTREEVELAIKEKLAAYPTDLFRNTETVIITLQDEGEGGRPKGTK